jgi:DNA (cytosine-5)-methyltransferase 1
MPDQMKALDLYSGVGGWSLGLRLSGIDVCASYERSEAANETNRQNNRHLAITTDIRKIDLNMLPEDIQVVVGSPPCTQFSFSNRGGNGDLSDGLTDVIQFLRIVDRVKPAAWAMENVPRLSKILDEELKDGGCLAEFRHLQINYDVFNMEEFGLPQRRRRCIVGNFDFDLLRSYRKETERHTLGDVIDGLSTSPVRDPLFGMVLSRANLHDHSLEESLDEEEARINRAAKLLHPIYNSMPFPDPLDRAVRTVTATCTRVSRESIVVPTYRGSASYRRLTVRERASAQGFPISYQFYGASHGQKLQMVGNAIPPLFAYFVGHALLGTSPANLPTLASNSGRLNLPPAPPVTEPHKRGFRYRADRSFKFSIPNLRLKSGVRFELSNDAHGTAIDWHVMLVFGTSKAIRKFRPPSTLEALTLGTLSEASKRSIDAIIRNAKASLSKVDVSHLQAVWSHTGPGATRPFMLLDLLDEFAGDLICLLEKNPDECRRVLSVLLSQSLGEDTISGTAKLMQYAPIILAGMIVGSCANSAFSGDKKPSATRLTGTRRATS